MPRRSPFRSAVLRRATVQRDAIRHLWWRWLASAALALLVPVALRAQTISLASTTATFASTSAVPLPAVQNLSITNTGAAALTGVQVGAVSYTAGQPSGWLTAINIFGNNTTIAPNGVQTLRLTATPGSLPAGTYTANVSVGANNATNGSVVVNVTFTVAGPTLQLGASAVSFASTSAQPQPPIQNIAISNVGSSSMTGVQVSAVAYTAGQPTGWLGALNIFGANTTIPAGSAQTVRLTATPGSLPAGTYTATVSISAANATNAPQTIVVTFTVAGPTLQPDATQITFASTSAQPLPPLQNIAITNTGSSTLTGVQVSAISYTAGQPTGWLNAFNIFGTNTSITPGAAQTVRLTVAPGALPAGSYTASFTISATNATNGPVTVNVTLTVAGPTLQLSANSATFRSTSALPQPPLQNIAIDNVGSTTLTGVQVSGVSYAAGQPTGWLTAINTFGTNTSIAPGGSQTLRMTVTPGSLPAGTYTATLSVSAGNAGGGPVLVTVTFVVEGPRLAISDASPTFTSFLAGPTPAAQSLTLTNAGSTTVLGVALGTVTYPAGQPTGWLAVQNLSGLNPSIATNGSNTIRLTVSPGAVPVGTHTASFEITSSNANNSPLTVTVTLNRSAAPVIQFTPATVTITSSLGASSPAPTLVNVTGTALTDATVQSITYAAGQPAGWLAATLASPNTPTTVSLQATTGALAVGRYDATVTVSSASSGASQTLPVTFVVEPPPAIAINPASVAPAVQQGQSVFVSVTVNNSGGGTLTGLTTGTVTYGAGQPTGWLTAALQRSTAPTLLNLTSSAAGLAPGVYTATVPVSSSAALVGNSPQTATVTLTVTAPPAPSIALSRAGVAFAAVVGGTTPTAETIAITNAGSGALTGLAVSAVTYGVGQPTGWLTASLSGTAAPSTLTLTPTLGTLPPGTYTASLELASSAPNVTNSPRSISVSFTVSAPPTIALTATSVALTAPVNGNNPATRAITIANSGSGTVQGLALGPITYGAGQPVGWLTASISASTAPATLTIDAVTGSLPVGSYTAIVPVTSTNASNSPQALTVTFTITPVPAIALSASSVNFAAIVGGASPAQQNITVTNGGTGTLTGLVLDGVVYPAGQPIGWLAATLSSATAPATIGLQVNNTTFAPGQYTATLNVRSAAASNTPQTITVTYTLSGAPAIALSSNTLAFAAAAGGADPAAQTVVVSNSGSGALTGLAVGAITYGPGAAGWLTATASASVAPVTITVRPMVGALPAGTYDATVAVTSSSAANAPQLITVRLVVSPTPPTSRIVVSPGTLMLTMQSRAPSTRSATAQITSGGVGALSGLTAGTPVYASGSGWLSATLGTSSTPATLTLRTSTRTLGPGVYRASIALGAVSAATVPYDIVLEVVDLKACERALTDATQLSQSERARLDQLGNNDGTYNLGDYLALRARLGI